MNVDFQPRNAVATFTDEYGDEKIIHRPKGRRLSVFMGGNTVALRMNRVAAIIIGRNIKKIRLNRGMTMRDLCIKAGLQNSYPKSYINSIESATRKAGYRMGTLYAIAWALECEVSDLLPKKEEVMIEANISETIKALTV